MESLPRIREVLTHYPYISSWMLYAQVSIKQGRVYELWRIIQPLPPQYANESTQVIFRGLASFNRLCQRQVIRGFDRGNQFHDVLFLDRCAPTTRPNTHHKTRLPCRRFLFLCFLLI